MTRFNISLETGVKFVINSILSMNGGETFIPKMDTIKILDLIKVLKPPKGFREIGIKPGEKIHEELISVSDNSIKIETRGYFIILPSTVNKNDKIVSLVKNKHKGKIINNNFSYNSNDAGKRLSLTSINKLIKQNQKNRVMSLAIIPARGGSQRIKSKNIKDFGKPVIYYAIRLAKNKSF